MDVSFWRVLGKKKLDEYKLSDAPRALVGSYLPSKHPSVPAQVCMGDYSFDETAASLPAASCACPVTLFNCNTREQFKTMDKAALLHAQGKLILVRRHTRTHTHAHAAYVYAYATTVATASITHPLPPTPRTTLRRAGRPPIPCC